jgi:hypothetical protein
MRLGLFATTIFAVACAHATLEDAQRKLDTGAFVEAQKDFDLLAAQKQMSPVNRARALTGAAQACVRLGRVDDARSRLERAIDPEVPGGSEAALYELAELERGHDRARALSLYYRAAAGAEKNLAGGFPYRSAMNRILELSNSR